MSRIAKFQLFYFLVLMSLVLAGLSVRRLAEAQYIQAISPAQAQTSDVDVQRVTPAAKLATTEDSQYSQIEASYGNLPLSFEPNRGQTDAQVKFLSRAGHRTLWLTQDEAVLAVGRPSRTRSSRKGALMESAPTDQTTRPVLRMKFLGANSSAPIAGEDQQGGTVNYFIGKPEQWRTKVPTYARVRYSSLYPGIDLVFYGNHRQLEYDLVVSPGADPGQIKLRISGAEGLNLDTDGNLVLKSSAGDVIQQKPRTYQRKGGKFVAIAGEYVINGKDEVGFRLGNYDRRAAVVIDPVLRYSTFLGGTGSDTGRAIAVDSKNRAVVTGSTCSPNFPVTDGSTPPINTFFCSVFVTKFDFTGSHVVFSDLISNAFISDTLESRGIALDSSDNVYVTGITSTGNFPTTPGAFRTTFGGGLGDGFALKLNSSGRALLYSTFLGGSALDLGSGIAVDDAKSAYIIGVTSSEDFPTTSGAFQRDCKIRDGICSAHFITKLAANGSSAVYSTFLGGTASSLGPFAGIAVDSAGDAFVVGTTQASDFPTTAGSAQPVFGGLEDAFVAELSPSGSHLVYSTYLGGSDADDGNAIALDGQGNAYITGITDSSNFPVKNAFQPHCVILQVICITAFTTKLSPTGRLVYSTYLGGEGAGEGTGIDVTPGGQAYVTGFTKSKKFPVTQSAFQRVFAGGESDIFLTKFDSLGKVIYSSYLGGSGEEFFSVVALDSDTNAYLAGSIIFPEPGVTPSFPVTPGVFQPKPGGGLSDAFVAKVVPLCALSTVNRSVTICSPGTGSTVKSPVRIIAGTTDVTPVKLTQIYLDGKKIFEQPLSALNVALPITGGTHRLTVQGLDTAKVFFKKSISINVSPH